MSILDNMSLLANVHNKKYIEELSKRSKERITELERFFSLAYSSSSLEEHRAVQLANFYKAI